jgi:hypothetical protein
VDIIEDWGYLSSVPYQVYGVPLPVSDCEWHYGNWRNVHELELVRSGVERLATKMGGPEKFKSAMKNRPIEITRVPTLLPPFTNNTGLALPEIPLYFMVDGLMLPNGAFDHGDLFATYTTVHELGHVWDLRSSLWLSIGMANQLGNAKAGHNEDLFGCLFQIGSSNPAIRFNCAMKYWEYNSANEAAPGNPNDLYASYSITEDWAEAVANKVFPEYGDSRANWRRIGPIRKIYVEMMMNNIH